MVMPCELDKAYVRGWLIHNLREFATDGAAQSGGHDWACPTGDPADCRLSCQGCLAVETGDPAGLAIAAAILQGFEPVLEVQFQSLFPRIQASADSLMMAT